MWNCLEFCCMLYKNRISWNLCCHFRWQTIFLCFYCNIYEMKPDIFEIFRTSVFEIFRKKSGISGNILRRFLVIFVSRPTPTLVSPRNNVWETSAEERLSMGSMEGAVWEICFNQSEALPRSGKWRVISVEFLRSFVRGHRETSDGVVWLMSVVFLTPPYDAMAKALQP